MLLLDARFGKSSAAIYVNSFLYCVRNLLITRSAYLVCRRAINFFAKNELFKTLPTASFDETKRILMVYLVRKKKFTPSRF